jgi:hypothetical protein
MMGTGHTILTLAAFLLLSTLIVNFYDLSGSAGDSISSGQDGIFLTSITTSYIETAQALAFDKITDTMKVGVTNVTDLTSACSLGPDAGEDSIQAFNDFDDFNGLSLEREAGTSGRRYRTNFTVSYVNPDNLANTTTTRTFVKRLDMKTWRTYPPAGDAMIDTLRTSFIMGYFHFD